MKAELVDLLCCPACRGALALNGSQIIRHDEIWTATLTCAACATDYPVAEGMPRLFVNDARWAPKAREAAGWVEIHKQQNIYIQEEDAVDLLIPFCLQDPWMYVGKNFDAAVQTLALTGDETILDLGAMRGWASKNFAWRGCRGVAIDVVADDQVGLGRARALMDHGATYFERVIGDGENLPFHEGMFDLVFCSATLHHFSDLKLVFHNIARVLKPGGRFCAVNEPCISYIEREATMLASYAADEMAVGINETRPHFPDYADAVAGAGLEIELAVPALAHNTSDEELRQWAINVGAVRPPLTTNLRELAWRTLKLGYMRYRALRNHRRLFWPRPASLPRAELGVEALKWATGDMLLIARRPS